MLDAVRSLLHRALVSPVGDGLTPVRVAKDVARGVNDMLGAPLCDPQEAERRRGAARRLAELRHAPKTASRRREPAPVFLYHDADQRTRERVAMQKVLEARGIAYRELDVSHDEPAQSFVTRMARCTRDDLPVVLVADRSFGGLKTLTEADATGELGRAVFGEPAGA